MNIYLFLEIEPTLDPALDELIENLGDYVHVTYFIRHLMREQRETNDPGVRLSLAPRLTRLKQQRRSIHSEGIQKNINEITEDGMTLSQLLDRLRELLNEQVTGQLEELLIREH